MRRRYFGPGARGGVERALPKGNRGNHRTRFGEIQQVDLVVQLPKTSADVRSLAPTQSSAASNSRLREVHNVQQMLNLETRR